MQIEMKDVRDLRDLADKIGLNSAKKPISELKDYIDGEIELLSRLSLIIAVVVATKETMTPSMFIDPFLQRAIKLAGEQALSKKTEIKKARTKLAKERAKGTK